MPYDTLKKWCAAEEWTTGGLPTPIHIGANSGLGARGTMAGQRRRRTDHIHSFVDATAHACGHRLVNR